MTKEEKQKIEDANHLWCFYSYMLWTKCGSRIIDKDKITLSEIRMSRKRFLAAKKILFDNNIIKKTKVKQEAWEVQDMKDIPRIITATILVETY